MKKVLEVAGVAPENREKRFVVRLFYLQLRGELAKMAARPRSYLGFGVACAVELVLCLLLHVAPVRRLIERDLWRVKLPLQESLSGLTIAAHILGDAMLLVGAFALALVGGDLVAKEAEDGTLRTVFSHPVGRLAVFAQKLIALMIYTAALVAFMGGCALGLGLLLDGRGRLVMVAMQENVFGILDFSTGLTRYALAAGLLAIGDFSIALLAFTFSCWRMKPAAATALALTVLLADDAIRQMPALSAAYPYCLVTRLLTWRQVFNDDIPWARLERNLGFLAWLDLALVLVAWLAFRRREFTARE